MSTTRGGTTTSDRIDLTALRKLAEDATPGPWAIEPHPFGNSPARSIHVADRDPDEFPVVSQLGCGCCDVGLDADAEDLAYIAAANPATVLRLIAAVRAALDLADGWAARGEHLMAYSKTVPEEAGTPLLENGAEFVERARILRSAITTALGADDD